MLSPPNSAARLDRDELFRDRRVLVRSELSGGRSDHLSANPLLPEPLQPKHIKPAAGTFGTVPG